LQGFRKYEWQLFSYFLLSHLLIVTVACMASGDLRNSSYQLARNVERAIKFE